MRGRRPRSTEVILNVYDLSPVNDWGHPVGLGVFHSGIQVDDREYTFAGGGGIFNHDPRKAPGARFREALSMGSFSGEPGVLERALDALRDEFGPDRYNVLTRNCNTFSSALCEALLGRPIPGYVNRLAWMGSWFSCLVPPHLLGEAPVNDGSTASSGYQMIAPPGRTSAVGGRGVGSGGKGPYSAFAGSGMSLSGTAGGNAGMSGSSGTSGGDGTRERELSDRRDRMRAAALRRAEAAAAQAAAPSAGGVNIKSA